MLPAYLTNLDPYSSNKEKHLSPQKNLGFFEHLMVDVSSDPSKNNQLSKYFDVGVNPQIGFLPPKSTEF